MTKVTRAGTASFGVLAFVVTALSTTADAQTERSGSADARVVQQLQQMSAERAALQSDNAKLKQEVEQLKKDLQQATAARSSLESRNKALSANASRDVASGRQAEEQLERTRGQMQELVGKFRETTQTMRNIEYERSELRNKLTAREAELRTCVDRNVGLYDLNTEVLDRLEGRGFWSNLAEQEPFLKLKRTQLENLIDDYKHRAGELALPSARATASAGAP